MVFRIEPGTALVIPGLHTLISCFKIEYDHSVHFAVPVGTLIVIYYEMNYKCSYTHHQNFYENMQVSKKSGILYYMWMLPSKVMPYLLRLAAPLTDSSIVHWNDF